MIKYVKRKDLDIEKYNACVEKSVQSRIYAFSWYLDIAVDNWDALVLDNYKAVMPIPWRKKYFIKYVYTPFWLLELGVFSIDDKIDTFLFYKQLFRHFKFVESRLNTDNYLKDGSFLIEKKMQVLSINVAYSLIAEKYRKDRKKDLQKANKINLIEKWNDSPSQLIQLFKQNVGKRTPLIVDKDYVVLENLMNYCIDHKTGEILSIYNQENRLVASGFFLKHKTKVTILVSSTDFNYRKNGENTFLIDRAIHKYQRDYDVFHFGGSSMTSIANYFLSFGSETLTYQQLKYNNLPFLVKFFKR